MKPNKQVYVDWIVKYIKRNEIVERKTVFAKFCDKFPVSSRTFDNYWRAAQDKIGSEQEKVSKAIDEAIEKTADKAAEYKILTKAERLEIASLIANSSTEKPADRIKAMDYISKIQGEYITKVAQTDSEGNDVGFTINSADQLREFLNGKK